MNRFTLPLAALLLALLHPASSRVLTRREPGQVEVEEVHEKMVGGYEHVQDLRTNQMVREASTFALQALQEERPYAFGAQDIDTVQVIDAWQQVVAGINFRLTLLFVNKDGNGDDSYDCVGACEVQIYNQFGTLSVTKWKKELSCEEAAVMMKESEGDEN